MLQADDVSLRSIDGGADSAGLTIVANVAIVTGPAVLCVKFVHYNMQRYILQFRCPRQILSKGSRYFTHDTGTLFAERKLNFSFCLGNCFCVKVHVTL